MTTSVFDQGQITAKHVLQAETADSLGDQIKLKKLQVWQNIVSAMSEYKDEDWQAVAQYLARASDRAQALQTLLNRGDKQ